MAEDSLDLADLLMQQYADRTGLTSERTRTRYLWTDAYAVCNFLSLARHFGESRLELALRLVDQVHRTLGRHRSDDPRRGWISGLGEEEGKAHPTRGGLRIGKPLPERGAGDAMDQRLEWERDGQYFHYLTQWMHALDQVARATGEARFNAWARELAAAAYGRFVRVSSAGGISMCWKMSIDLTRPLVASMGQHDPVDGFVVFRQLDATGASFGSRQAGPALAEQAGQLESLARGMRLETTDALGIGGLLLDAARLGQTGGPSTDEWFDALVSAASAGLRHASGELERPPEQRLAFRELGLAVGLQAIRALEPAERLDALTQHAALGNEIEAQWRDAEQRRSRGWNAHSDINDVMLSTVLVPEGFVVLHENRRAS